MRTRIRIPSPSSALAAAALFVALGGSALAAAEQLPRGSVGTAQLKRGAVTSEKIKDGAILSRDVRNGSLLRADFRAGQLPAGPPGPAGPQGPPGLSGLQVVVAETATSSASPKTITAVCPAGKRAIAGGIEVGGAGRSRVTVTESHPTGDTSWEAEAFEAVATAAAWKLVVHAVCAAVAA
ncbi:MAG TPA: hypothetical protein VNJ46_05525 [Gaiellaceae bacterium]|nr:hypothetical protein [Gaiellaceae bacterium]